MADYLKALYGLYMPNEKFEGQGLVEYALILALISVVAIVIMVALGGKVKGVFSKVNASMNTTSSS